MKAVFAAIIVFALTAGGIYLWLARSEHQEQQITTGPLVPKSRPIPTLPQGKFLYRSPILHFQLTYPDTLVKRVYAKGNTSTIAFQDNENDIGFQIFVVPYKEETVSEERFKMDIPSGEYRDPMDVIIDGSPAVAFISKDSVLGDTREVWFIRDGLLYEVTARKDLDEWLSQIMATWQFI